jgi:hypothetical protein
MAKTIRTILALAAAFIVLYMAVSLGSNIAQVAAAADRVHLGAGQPVFWILVTLFAALFMVPVAMFLLLPKPLIAPKETSGPEHDAYVRKLTAQLARNPRLAGMALGSDEEVAAAIAKLDAEAKAVIRNTASVIFASTAVMQNGRLDALIVFGSQVRMTWRIASIYYQRPSPRQMLYLYGNVGANMLVADNIADVDFSGIVTPIVTAIFPSLKGAVPGLQGVSTLLVNSTAHGAANAFLTLRVGMIARSYCAAMTSPVRAEVRRSASLAALALIGEIAREQGSRVAQAAWDGVRRSVQTTAVATVRETKGALGSLFQRSTPAVSKGDDGIAKP